MPDVTFRKALDEEMQLVNEIIADHHSHLVGIPLAVWFRSKHKKSQGRIIFGQAKLKTNLDALMMFEYPFGFIIELAEDIWITLKPAQRKALIDHELCHCVIETNDKTGEDEPGIRGHDMEEFREIIQRHGLWIDHVKAMAVSMQPHLPGLSIAS